MIDYAGLIPLLTALFAAMVALLKWYQETQTKAAVIDFFDPAVTHTTATVPPTVMAQIPTRTYLMNDDLKRFLTHGESATDQALIQSQIAAAEATGQVKYDIHYSLGFYHIEYGLVAYGGRGK